MRSQPTSSRLVMTAALLGALACSTAACSTILGIDDVSEIQPTTTGTGGTGASGGTGPTTTQGGGGQGGATTTTEVSCDSLGWKCGKEIVNGGPIDCGPCTDPNICIDHACVCPGESCESLGWECDSGPDICGNTVTCPDCEDGYGCDHHECVCIPETCESRGWKCGGGPDGCGNGLTCPSCAADEKCMFHKCECVPVDPCEKTSCGTLMDNCDKPVDCGDCSVLCGVPSTCTKGTCDCNAPL